MFLALSGSRAEMPIAALILPESDADSGFKCVSSWTRDLSDRFQRPLRMFSATSAVLAFAETSSRRAR